LDDRFRAAQPSEAAEEVSMESCDVLIVGGGPAGSTCAWKLRQAGLDVVIVDKAVFPRDKTCAGWITPSVVEALELDTADYGRSRVFQSIEGFHVALLGRRGRDIPFGEPVSYGIRRYEFDDFLLTRSGARLRLGEAATRLERTPGGWLLNGTLQARMLVGAGGHFCPVARLLRSSSPERPQLVTAVEAEFPVPAEADCSTTEAAVPRLYFRDDLAGYGWCIRKRDFLNIGIGLVDSRETATEIERLLSILRRERAFAGDVPVRFRGHAYYLYDGCDSKIVDDAVLLVGDAAGLAFPRSGEGIRPAVESGLLAAEVIFEADGQFDLPRLTPYRERLMGLLGPPARPPLKGPLAALAQGLRRILVRGLMRSSRFVRQTVIESSFLNPKPA